MKKVEVFFEPVEASSEGIEFIIIGESIVVKVSALRGAFVQPFVRSVVDLNFVSTRANWGARGSLRRMQKNGQC